MKKSLFILLAIFVALLATPSCKKEKGTEGPPAIESERCFSGQNNCGTESWRQSKTSRDGHSG